MSTSIVYDGYLERYSNGTCLAQLTDLPGCFTHGTAADDAIQRLAGAIPAYYAWLARHDDYTPLVQGAAQVALKEVQDTTPERGAFFAPDAAPVTAEDLDWYLALLDWAVADLIAMARAMPVDILERVGADGRSGREALVDIGARLTQGLAYVLGQPGPASPNALPLTDVLTWLESTVHACADQLRAVSDEDRARIVEREGTHWSVRRVLRQAVLDARVQLTAFGAA